MASSDGSACLYTIPQTSHCTAPNFFCPTSYKYNKNNFWCLFAWCI
jgi:hypothetical protein